MKVWINGANGLVGRSLISLSNKFSNYKIISTTRNEVDLFEYKQIKSFITKYKPETLINCAAKVGGIYANNTLRTDFLLENLKINMNILESIIPYNKIKLINLGSSCIYPLDALNPIDESFIMTGKLEPTNSSYAMAKLTAIEMGDAMSQQYGHKILNLMPTNLYGPNDNFDDTSSHVIPGLMQRLHRAKISKDNSFKVWGSGKPKREFLYVDDLAKAIIFLIENEIESGILNIGSGVEITIAELVNLLIKIVGFEGNVEFNTSMPDGNPRKLIDSKKINNLGWSHETDLENGLKLTYEWYKNNVT